MSEPAPPAVHGAAASSREEPFPGVSRETHQGERATVTAYAFAPGASFPRHSHPEEQVTVFVAGEVEVTVGDETRCFGAGETCVIAPGLEHQMTAGPKGARFVALIAPRREHPNAYQIEEGE